MTLQKSSNSFSYSFSNSIPFHLPGDDISRKKILEFKEKIKREKDESDRLRQFIAQPIPNRVVSRLYIDRFIIFFKEYY